MKYAVIDNPHIVWTTLQSMASKYAVRIQTAGRKIILRADHAEDLVRMLSRIRTIQGA